MKNIIFAVVLFISAFAAKAESLKVLTTIKPLQSIVQNIAGNETKVDALLGKNNSPHDYSLRPSDAMKIHDADLVFYISNDLENFMSKITKSSKNNEGKFFELINLTPGLNLLKNRESKAHKHDHEDNHHDHKHDHYHGEFDPHVWLDVDNVYAIAKYVSHILSEKNPNNKSQYEENLLNFKNKLDLLDKSIKNKMEPYKNFNFIALHDAYQYFDTRYSLNFVIEILMNDHQTPTAKKILQIKNIIKERQIKCIFVESQLNNKIVDLLVKDEKIPTAILNAEWGSDSKDVSKIYFNLMNDISENISSCFSVSIN